MSARILASSLLSLIIFLSLQTQAQSNPRYLLLSKTPGSLKSAVTKKGGTHVRDLEFTSGIVAHVSSSALGQLKKEFSDLEVIADIEFHLVGKPSGSTSTVNVINPEATPWGLTAIRAPQAQTIARGAGIKVCIVDTGVDKTHPDLKANIVGGRNYIVSRGHVDPTNYGDDNGHGTHVAGTIAAVDNDFGVLGIAPDAKIFSVKALDKRGSGYFSDITDGVYECVRQGAHVINMSLGANSDPTVNSAFKQACDGAAAAGLKVVVAAGNEGQDIKNTIPAGYSSVIAVAAIDVNNDFPYWTNFGLGTKDFSAPGVAILSTWKGGIYNTISGTSMASPHVAGVIALQLSAKKTATKAVDLGKSTSQQGAGRVDALLSVQ